MCSSSCSLKYQGFIRNQEGKIELRKIIHRGICVRDITFLTARPPFYAIFCCFLCLLTPPFPSDVLVEWALPIKIHNIAMVGILCDEWTVENMNGLKNILQFNTSWLASSGTWYCSRLCFSFSCPGYDLTLITNLTDLTLFTCKNFMLSNFM